MWTYSERAGRSGCSPTLVLPRSITSATCGITLAPDPITANTGRLLSNIKAGRLDTASIAATASFFEELPTDRADTLAAGLFGLYTDVKRTAVVAHNVRLLWPEIWDIVSDDARHAFGTPHG